MSKRTLRALEDRLDGMCPPADAGHDPCHFLTTGHRSLLWHYEQAKADVAKLGMTDIVETAIRDCLELVKQSRGAEAQDLLRETAGMLMEKSGRIDKYRRALTPSELEDFRAREAAAAIRRIKRSLARKPRVLRSAFDSNDNPRPDIVDPEASPLRQAEQLAAYLRDQGVDPDKAALQAGGAIVEQFFKRGLEPDLRHQNTPQVAAEIGVLVQRAMDALAADAKPEAVQKLRLEGVLDRVAAVQPMLKELESSAGRARVKKESGGGAL